MVRLARDVSGTDLYPTPQERGAAEAPRTRADKTRADDEAARAGR